MKYYNSNIAVENFKKRNKKFKDSSFMDIMLYIIAGEIVNIETNKEYYINGVLNKNVNIKKDYNSYIINDNEYSYNMNKGYIYLYGSDEIQKFEIYDNFLKILNDLINEFYDNLKENKISNFYINNTNGNNILEIKKISKMKRNINFEEEKRNYNFDYEWIIKFHNINYDDKSIYNSNASRLEFIPLNNNNLGYANIYSLNTIIFDNISLFNFKNEARFINYPNLKDFKILNNIEIIDNVYVYEFHTNILLEISKRFVNIDKQKFYDCKMNIYYINYNNLNLINNKTVYTSKNWLEEITYYLENKIIDEVKSDEVKNDEIKSDEIKSDEIKSDEIKSDEIKSDEIKNDEVKSNEVINDRKQKLIEKYKFVKKNINIDGNPINYNNLKCYFTGIPLYDQVYVFDIYKYKNIKINYPIHILVSPYVIHFYEDFIKDFELLTDTKIILFKTLVPLIFYEVIENIGINQYDIKILNSLYKSHILLGIYTISNIITENELKNKYNYKIGEFYDYKNLNYDERILLLNNETEINSEILIDIILKWKMPFIAKIKNINNV